jgi:hypothetical protein
MSSTSPSRPTKGSKQSNKSDASNPSSPLVKPKDASTRSNIQGGVLGHRRDTLEREENQTAPHDQHDISSVFSDRFEEFRVATMRDFSQQGTANRNLTAENSNLEQKNKILTTELKKEKKSTTLLGSKITNLTQENERLKLDLNQEREAREELAEKDAQISRLNSENKVLKLALQQNKERLEKHKKAMLRNLSAL